VLSRIPRTGESLKFDDMEAQTIFFYDVKREATFFYDCHNNKGMAHKC